MANLLIGSTGSVFDTTRTFRGASIKAWRSAGGTLYTRSMGVCECGRRWNEHEFAHGYCPWWRPGVDVRPE